MLIHCFVLYFVFANDVIAENVDSLFSVKRNTNWLFDDDSRFVQTEIANVLFQFIFIVVFSMTSFIFKLPIVNCVSYIIATTSE